MATKREITTYEDSYSAVVFTDFESMCRAFAFCEDEFYGRWNVPVWMDFDAGNENCLSIGIMGTRHGNCWQYVLENATQDQVEEMRRRIMSVWVGRAEGGFERHPALPKVRA